MSNSIETLEDAGYPNGNGDIFIVDSGRSGNNLWISSGVHGNEIGPIQAVDALLNDIREGVTVVSSGKIVIVPFGNPLAVQNGVRDIEGRDLNRMFGSEDNNTLDLSQSESLERKRAEFLMGIMNEQSISHVLDLHSLSGKSPVPFIYCPDDVSKIRFATELGVAHIVIGWAKLAEVLKKRGIERALRPGLADYGNILGNTALTFEAGTHDSPNAEGNTRKFLANALSILSMSGGNPIEHIGGEETIAIDMTDVYLGCDPENVDFHWIVNPVNFMSFGERTLVAKDHSNDVFMEAHTILVQPKKIESMKPGQEAFFIGRPRSL